MPEKMNKIGILGAGLMGHGLAQVFSAHGCDVRVYDHHPDNLESIPDLIRRNLDVFVRMKIMDEAEAEKTLERIFLADSLEAMCQGRDFVVEAISEDLAAKKQAFSEMERHLPPEAIIASNTSAIPIRLISEGLQRPERVLGTHFWNPPHILPCVEVIKAEQTSETVFESTYHLMQQVGKVPVRVLKDIPGFLGNRMQHALWREAISLVENGIASAEDVDKVVRSAFGLRLAFMGPLETADLAGLDLTQSIQKDLLPQLEASTLPSPLLTEKIKKGSIGAKCGEGFHKWSPKKVKGMVEQRDRTLLSMLTLLKSE